MVPDKMLEDPDGYFEVKSLLFRNTTYCRSDHVAPRSAIAPRIAISSSFLSIAAPLST